VPAALDEYLKSLRPVPGPHLVDGRLSAAAERGKQLFLSGKAGCAGCHPPPWFTDLGAYHVGTQGDYDKSSDQFDTPTLVELWRTAPYLHDGSAATLRDVLTTKNPADQHGNTSHLSPQEIDDVVEYLLSL
jgi:cytochrome c peroxidase